MTQLARSFERDFREAALDEVESDLVGQRDSIVHRLVTLIHEDLRAYASRYGYDVEGTIDSITQPEVDRSRDGVTVTFGWEDESMARWEWGTTAHTVEGDPILSFVWAENDKRGDDPPEWVKEEFPQARSSGGRFESGWRVFFSEVQVDGIPPSRAIRDNLNAFRQVFG